MLEFLIGLAQIMLVNIVLSGDNAVVIALASRGLPAKKQKLAIIIGSGGAIVLRILLTIAAVFILKIPFLQLIGGAFLVWIAVKLLIQQDEGDEISTHDGLLAAVRTIIVADIIMSLDNTLAIAAAAKGDILLLSLGLALSVPLIVFGSQLIVFIMEKFPVIVYIGAGLIAWTAGELIKGDQQIAHYIPEPVGLALPAALTALVVGGAFLYNRRKSRTAADVLVADEHAAKHFDDRL